MTEFERLYTEAREAKYVLDEKEEILYSFVNKVLKGLGYESSTFCDHVVVEPNEVELRLAWSRRGYTDFEYLSLPRYLFESENPEESAEKYKKNQKLATKRAGREEKKRKIQQLQKELDTE